MILEVLVVYFFTGNMNLLLWMTALLLGNNTAKIDITLQEPSLGDLEYQQQNYLQDAKEYELQERWQQYKSMYNKYYDDDDEDNRRKNIFFDNAKFIDDHNKLYNRGISTIELGHNEFSDLTHDEFLEQYTTHTSSDYNSVDNENPIDNFEPTVRNHPIVHYDNPTVRYDNPTVRYDNPTVRYDNPTVRNDHLIVRNDPAVFDHPTVRNNHPTVRYDNPTVRYDNPTVRNDHLNVRNDRAVFDHPTVRYDNPTVRYDIPTVRYDNPTVRYDNPTVRYDNPTVRYDNPTVRYDNPTVRYDNPTVRYDNPTVRYDNPTVRYDNPTVRYDNPTVRNKRTKQTNMYDEPTLHSEPIEKRYLGSRYAPLFPIESPHDKVDQKSARDDTLEFLVPENVMLPYTVDWRSAGAVTPVKDQGKWCKASWLFSTTGSLEGQVFRRTRELTPLSEQNILDCSDKYGNNGCRNGTTLNSFRYILMNGGIDVNGTYPWYGKKLWACHYKKYPFNPKIFGIVKIQSGNETALQAAVATVGPVAVAVDASNRKFQFYKRGIYNDPFCGTTRLNHEMLAVGYGRDFWIVKNSFGKSWGEKGYILMARNKKNQCGIATRALYPLV